MDEQKNIQIDAFKRTVTWNDKTYDFPEQADGENIFMVDDDLFVDGYQLKDGKWKKTLTGIKNNWRVKLHKKIQ